jgi:Squalene-hopene cyclase C-terminal domain
VSSRRPPSESSDFTATALALRGVLAFGPSGLAATANDGAQKKSLDQPVRAAEVPWREPVLRWLTRTKPRDTEDRVFRLWGLKSAGASADELARAVAELLKVQRLDGGWSQLDTSPESPKGEADKGGSVTRATPASALQSDAYATGSVLVGLALAGGLDSKNPAYCRGLEFLLQTQRDDGSWFVKSRSRPFQAYFESGFPHGPDQFISAAASAWAVAALTLALPIP